MNIILHIGINKTGSSSLQKFCFENKEKLREVGYVYPNIGIGYGAHHGIAFEIARNGNSERIGPLDRWNMLESNWLEKLEQDVDESEWVILSSEAFHGNNRPDLVYEKLKKHNVKVFVYVREHFAYLRSWYQQTIQQKNSSLEIDEFEKCVTVSQGEMIRKWADYFGKENVICNVFNRSTLENENIVDDFFVKISQFTSTAFDSTHYSRGSDSNPSISGNLIFIKKLLNHFITEQEALKLADEFGALSIIKDSFSGPIEINNELVESIRWKYRDDRKILSEIIGFDMSKIPYSGLGNISPDFEELSEDYERILCECERTNKNVTQLLAMIDLKKFKF